jgi:hypothetical protein
MKFGDWINKSVIPFFKELKDMIYLIKQLEWDILYKETKKEIKKEIKKWWHDYSVEIITIGVGAVITITLAHILYHYIAYGLSLIK